MVYPKRIQVFPFHIQKQVYQGFKFEKMSTGMVQFRVDMASYSPKVTNMAVFISLIFLVIPSAISDCVVKNAETDIEEPCVFPFTINYTRGSIPRKKTFNSCTDFEDPDGKFWCSTKVCYTIIHTYVYYQEQML